MWPQAARVSGTSRRGDVGETRAALREFLADDEEEDRAGDEVGEADGETERSGIRVRKASTTMPPKASTVARMSICLRRRTRLAGSDAGVLAGFEEGSGIEGCGRGRQVGGLTLFR